MNPQTPLDHVDGAAERLVETTLDLLRFDTQNPPGQTARVVAYLESALDTAGLVTRRIACSNDNPGLVAWLPDEPAPELVFAGHVDTVPYDSGEWTVDPLGERDGDIVYGRGASDMKGAVAAMVEAAKAYAETGERPAMPVGFAFVGDEEVARGDDLTTAIDAFAAQPNTCVIGEMTGTPERPSLTVADKGSIWLTLTATGESAHGSRPMFGRNAIDVLYGTIGELRAELSQITFDLDPAVERIVTESIEYYAHELEENQADQLFRQPTLNLGTFDGGTAMNSVPASATAGVDIRLTAAVSTADVLERVRDVVAESPAVDIDSVDWSTGTFEQLDAPVVTAVGQAAERATGTRVYRRSATGGGDAKTLRNAGVETVEFALGAETVHASDEYTTVEALTRTAATYVRTPVVLERALRGDGDE